MRWSIFSLLALVACNVDRVSTNGELGHLSFSLSSAWYLDPTELTEVDIVTGHVQNIGVGLTDEGRELAEGDAQAITYVVSPDRAVDVLSEAEGDSEEAPELSLNVRDPGDYVIEARLNGDVFDRIQLGFDAPAVLELAAFVRDPWESEFDALGVEAPMQVQQGAQLAWLPIPVGAAGERLAGALETDLSADPMSAVVPAENVSYVNEDEVFDSAGVPSLYFVETGDVTVSLTDPVTTVAAELAFTVVD